MYRAVASRGEDWPQWRGPHRDAVWHETNILQSFPPDGLKVIWRVPVGIGFSSPVVAQGRVYVTDSHVTRTNARENVRLPGRRHGRGDLAPHFNKDSGRQVWEALDEIPFNTSPIVIDFAGSRQLIVWAYKSVAALDPLTGRILWRREIPVGGNYAVPSPVWKDDLLLLSGLMLKLDRDKPGASILWPDELRPLRINLSDPSTPLLLDGLVFSSTSKGDLVCLDATTGKQLCQTNGISESTSAASIHITAVPGIRCGFLVTDRGDLILARLTAAGYQELGRFHLLDPTADYGQRKMAWVPPAYPGQRVFARNDKELVCASLAAAPTNAPVK